MLTAPVLLSTEHQLDDFACGVDSLDDWLRRRAYPNRSAAHRAPMSLPKERELSAITALPPVR